MIIDEQSALEKFAKNLRICLETKGVTQKDLCRELKEQGGDEEKMSALEAKISRILNAKHMPSAAFVRRISKVLRIRMEKLLD